MIMLLIAVLDVGIVVGRPFVAFIVNVIIMAAIVGMYLETSRG